MAPVLMVVLGIDLQYMVAWLFRYTGWLAASVVLHLTYNLIIVTGISLI